jgi:hypothetical protein
MDQFTEFVALLKTCEDQYKIGQPRFKEWIISSGWDFKDNRNKWFVDEYGSGIMYGILTDGRLRDCIGIWINSYGDVWIAHWGADGI